MSRWYVTYCASKDGDEADRAEATGMPQLAPTRWTRCVLDLDAVVWFAEVREGDDEATAVRLDTGDSLVIRTPFDLFHDYHKAHRIEADRHARANVSSEG